MNMLSRACNSRSNANASSFISLSVKACHGKFLFGNPDGKACGLCWTCHAQNFGWKFQSRGCIVLQGSQPVRCRDGHVELWTTLFCQSCPRPCGTPKYVGLPRGRGLGQCATSAASAELIILASEKARGISGNTPTNTWMTPRNTPFVRNSPLILAIDPNKPNGTSK